MKLGFIGTGHMGGALVEGFSKTTYTSMMIYNRSLHHSTPLHEKYHCEIASSIEELTQSTDVIFLCTPAGITAEVLSAIQPSLQEHQLIISCASGVTLETLETIVKGKCAVLRAIPNIPVSVKAGATTLVYHETTAEKAKTIAHQLFEAVGQAIVLDEAKLNIASSIAGCSPAYIALLTEAMVDAGVYYGCSSDEALTLALLAIKGSAEVMLEKQLQPATLKYQVSSPKGDTIKGLLALEQYGFKHAMIEALKASTGERK